MGLFTKLFKKKSPSVQSNTEVFGKMVELLFGSREEMFKQAGELTTILHNRYKESEVGSALAWMTMRFANSADKSSIALVDEGQMRRPNNTFTRNDAMAIYKFVAKKSFSKLFPDADDVMFEEMMSTIGNNEGGATTDIIPGAYGEYGLCETNPIPTRGIPANEAYLKRLSLVSGEKFHWVRIGSLVAPNIEKPIDAYEIITDSGVKKCTIYISPYQLTNSNLAPKGFSIDR